MIDSLRHAEADTQMLSPADITVRRKIEVRGIVQGVGFRPFVYALAGDPGLSGFVRNVDGMVRIELQGSPENIDTLIHLLTVQPPPQAQIEKLDIVEQCPIDEVGFVIADSHCKTSHDILIAADIASCGDCLRELADPADRHFEYPFLNCTHCGPRLTIIQAAPYDRMRTTMARFEMCDDCRREYADPLDRPFSTITRIWPVAWPSTASMIRSSASSLTEPASEVTELFGAENF